MARAQTPKGFIWRQATETISKDEAVIWQDRTLRLSQTPQFMAKANDLLAVVKYPRNSLAAKLIKDFHGIVLTHIYEQNVDIAVLKIEGLEEINDIAQAVHEEFHSCGMIQVIHPTFLISPPETLKSILYDSNASLEAVSTLLSNVDISPIEETIISLSALPTRHHSTGTIASDLVSQIFAATIGDDARFSLNAISHELTEQQSITVTLPGTSTEKVVIGAHLDSINRNGVGEDAPGADDDASGVAILNEILRALVSQNASFSRTIELQAYAAEEVGLVGSQDIASGDTSTVAMMQIDMAMYGANGNDGHIHLVRDDTSANLRRHGIQLIKNYITENYSLGTLPSGATSDHKSFYQNGIPTLFPFEDTANYNKSIHSIEDVFEKLNNPDLAINVTKLGLAFLSHYGGLVSAQQEYDVLGNPVENMNNADIFLAAKEVSSGRYYLSVSTPEDVATVEICQIVAPEDIDCQKERIELGESLTRNDRTIFYGKLAQEVNDSETFRVWAYDSSDQLIHLRNVLAVVSESTTLHH